MKKILCFVVLLCTLLAVWAGGSGESTVVDPNARVVEFWHTMTGVNAAAIDSIVDDFNNTIGKEEGIYVRSVYQGNDNSEKLKTLAQAGDMGNFPDAAQIAGAGIPSAYEYESLVPIADLMNSTTIIDMNSIEPNMLRSYTYKDELIGMPFSCSAILLYYNVDMFKEAGIENPPSTISEMAEDISKLMIKNGNVVERYGLNVAVRRYQLANFIGGQGEYNFFGDNEGGRKDPMTRVTFGDDGTLRAYLTEWQKVVETGGYKPTEDDINEEFALELHAMAIMSSARIGKIESLVNGSFEWAVAPLPKVNESDTGGVAVGGSCIVMFDPDKDPEQVEATWKFVQFMASAEPQFKFHQATGYIPVNKDVYELPEIDAWFEENPAYKVAVDSIHASHPYVQEPFDIINWELDSIIMDHMLKFANGTETIDQCHDGIVNECNQKLADYHRANS